VLTDNEFVGGGDSVIEKTEVAVVGAGPYGLSLAAHLRDAGTDFRIIGHAMDAWRNHMPKGMLLKSDGFASNLYDPQGEYPLSRYCRDQGIAYHDKRIPVQLDTFVDYGLLFARRFVPELKTALVKSLCRDGDGFELRLDDDCLIKARRVVVAVGIERFKHIPGTLHRLGEQVSHSYDHRDLSTFTGRRIAVVGAGASAIDIAGLMRDHDADVELICRIDRLSFGGPPRPNDPSFWESLRNPSSGLGPGWRSRFCTDAPLVFHMGPASLRLLIVAKHLGPFAAFVMKEKIEGRVPVRSGSEIADAALQGARVRLTLSGPDGTASERSYDHVVAATGYRVDIGRLEFLNAALRSEIACVESTPILSTRFQSSVRGLFFVGPVAANSFGPMLRFAYGAGFASRRVADALKPRRSPLLFASRLPTTSAS
jgi:thioredoxin reductase